MHKCAQSSEKPLNVHAGTPKLHQDRLLLYSVIWATEKNSIQCHIGDWPKWPKDIVVRSWLHPSETPIAGAGLEIVRLPRGETVASSAQLTDVGSRAQGSSVLQSPLHAAIKHLKTYPLTLHLRVSCAILSHNVTAMEVQNHWKQNTKSLKWSVGNEINGHSTATSRVRPFSLYLLNQPTFNLDLLQACGSWSPTTESQVTGQGQGSVRVSKNGNAVGLLSIVDRCQFVF